MWIPIWAALITAVGAVLAATLPPMLRHDPAASHTPTVPGVTTSRPRTTAPGPGPKSKPPEHPTSTAPQPADDDSPDDPGLSTAEQDLAARVTGGDLSGCYHAAPGSYASVAVNCTSAGGPERDPLILSFDDADGLREWVIGTRSQFTVSETGTCETYKNYSDLWNHDGVQTGNVSCYWTDSVYRIAWSFDDQLVAVVAEDPDASALVTWWKTTPVEL